MLTQQLIHLEKKGEQNTNLTGIDVLNMSLHTTPNDQKYLSFCGGGQVTAGPSHHNSIKNGKGCRTILLYGLLSQNLHENSQI